MSSRKYVRLSSIADVQTGPFGSLFHEGDYVEYGMPMITVENIRDSRIALTPGTPMVSIPDAERLKKFALREGDVVFSRVGCVDRSAHATLAQQGWLFSGRLLRVRARPGTDAKFLHYYFSYEATKILIRNMAVGGTMASLNTGILKSLPIPDIKLAEQNGIVGILEIWDEAIDTLTAVIYAYTRAKNGLAQELLSGARRLAGFTSSWLPVRLGETTSLLKDGTHGSHIDVKDGIPLLSAKDIGDGQIDFQNEPRLISVGDFNHIHNKYKIQDEDILLSLVGSIGKVAIVANYHDNFTLQRSVGIIRFIKQNSRFMFYLFRAAKFQNELSKIQNKGAQGGVYLGNLSKLVLNLPTLPEQAAIANILTASDDEIATLMRKLALFKEQREYLLNNLMSGKIRTPESLKIPTQEPTHA